MPVVKRLVSAGVSGDAVIVHLGTNGPIDEPLVRSLLDQLTTARVVVLVNIRAPRDYEASVNATLAAVGATYPNVRLVDWHAATEGRPELFASDGIHVNGDGNALFADLITGALARA